MAIRFEENDARVMGRNASGVKGIELGSDDKVVGMVWEDAVISAICILRRKGCLSVLEIVTDGLICNPVNVTVKTCETMNKITLVKIEKLKQSGMDCWPHVATDVTEAGP